MNEAVNSGDCHGNVWEDLTPSTERLMGGQQEATTLIAMGNQVEQQGGLGFGVTDVAEIINDEQGKAVQAVEQH